MVQCDGPLVQWYVTSQIEWCCQSNQFIFLYLLFQTEPSIFIPLLLDHAVRDTGLILEALSLLDHH